MKVLKCIKKHMKSEGGGRERKKREREKKRKNTTEEGRVRKREIWLFCKQSFTLG